MQDRKVADVPISSRNESQHSGIGRHDNGGEPAHHEAAIDGGLAGTLASLGIVAVPSTMFEWGGYRYTNAGDAIAAAKRAAR